MTGLLAVLVDGVHRGGLAAHEALWVLEALAGGGFRMTSELCWSKPVRRGFVGRPPLGYHGRYN